MPGPKERSNFDLRQLGFRRAGYAHEIADPADPGWETSMTAAELIALGQSVFGWGWRTHLSHAIGVNRRMISYWQASQRAIPPEIASRIRELADIGLNLFLSCFFTTYGKSTAKMMGKLESLCDRLSPIRAAADRR